MYKGLITALFLALIRMVLHAQEPATRPDTAVVIGNDTLPAVDMRAVVIFPPVKHENRRQSVRYDKLVFNVKKVYPYAKLAGEKLRYYEMALDTIRGEKDRKAYMKQAQKELEAQFGKELREMTFSQGKILIKLVYRETGNSTYEIVQELRGNFTAFMWQTMAVLFGYNLKTGYDPEYSDQAIEQIVLMIEAGAL